MAAAAEDRIDRIDRIHSYVTLKVMGICTGRVGIGIGTGKETGDGHMG